MSFDVKSDGHRETSDQRDGHHPEQRASSWADGHPGGGIALVIDRLTAAMLETAAIRKGIVAKTANTDEIVNELRDLEETLKDLGLILRKLQDHPYEPLTNPNS